MEVINYAVDEKLSPPPEATTPREHPNDSTEDRAYALRVSEAMDGLLQDAVARNKQMTFVDAAIWHVAQLAAVGGPLVTGHIVELLGYRTRRFVQRLIAAEEAEEAKKAGHQPN